MHPSNFGCAVLFHLLRQHQESWRTCCFYQKIFHPLYISIDLKLVEMKKNRGQSFYYIIKPELRFCAGSNPARAVLEICDGEDLWQWSRLETRLNAFRQSTIPQKQFIIINFTSWTWENQSVYRKILLAGLKFLAQIPNCFDVFVQGEK